MEIYQRIFESAPDAQLVVDAAGRIALANAQAESLFGYGRTEMIGNTVEMLIPSRYHARHVNHRNAYLAAAHSRPMGEGQDLFGRHKNGEEFPVDIMLSPLQVDKGPFVLCVVRNLARSRP